MTETPFEYLEHLVTVPVLLNGVERTFVLDSGIGLTVVRDSVPGWTPTGRSFTGKRMSGQEVTLPLAVVPSLDFAGIVRPRCEVGLFDMSGFPDALAHVDGFLSLSFLSEQPFTVDYGRKVIREAVGLPGTAVDVRVVRDGPSLTVLAPLTIAGGRSVWVEVDMGSDSLILDASLAGEVDAPLEGRDVRIVEGTDETGFAYTRTFTRLPGSISLGGAPDLAQEGPDAMFQRIIYDGLIGDAFLRRFVVTWDIPASRMAFEPLST